VVKLTDDERPDPLFHYETGIEAERLERGRNKLERVRTEQLLRRFLPPPALTIHDVGGGAGAYTIWLAKLGYRVNLLDPVRLHIDQALAHVRTEGLERLVTACVGDARALPFEQESSDAVLMLGPLYHLIEAEDRALALREAHRVLKPGGILFAASINRFVSTFNGLFDQRYIDPEFLAMADRDLINGQHQPSPEKPYFTDAFFHHPDDLRNEVIAAGFELHAVLAVEGVASFLTDFDSWWGDAQKRKWILKVATALESEPTLLGASTHLMAIACRPSDT
jgi:ubiquinone/menaquinone biosynthesis C-methylase UbiE